MVIGAFFTASIVKIWRLKMSENNKKILKITVEKSIINVEFIQKEKK